MNLYDRKSLSINSDSWCTEKHASRVNVGRKTCYNHVNT